MVVEDIEETNLEPMYPHRDKNTEEEDKEQIIVKSDASLFQTKQEQPPVTNETKNDHDENNPKLLSLSSSYHHLLQILKLTGPIILSEFFQNVLPVVDLAFVGRLTGKNDLAAAALATMWFNIWNYAMLGFCTAVDTLLAQSYGAQEYETFAMWSGNGIIIISITSVLVGGLISLCEPAMVAFGQDPGLAAAAGQFSYRLLPGLIPYYVFKVLIKHLQTQNILVPGALIGLFANVFNIFTNWFFISYLSWGLNGAPIATTLTRVIELIMVIGYFFMKKATTLAQTWPSISLKNLKRNSVLSFMNLGISSALSFIAEAWSFEITTILSGLLGTIPLNAHVITLSVATFIYLSFPFAIGVATSIQVGQLIGEGSVKDAQRSCVVSFFLTFAVQGMLIILVWPSSGILGDLFSNDEDVSQLVSELIPLSCIFMMGDAIQSNAGGALRGLGEQKLLLVLNIIGFWILAIPFGSLLTFVGNIGVYGLWWGMTIGIYSSSILGICLLKFYINWGRAADMAKHRIALGNKDILGNHEE